MRKKDRLDVRDVGTNVAFHLVFFDRGSCCICLVSSIKSCLHWQRKMTPRYLLFMLRGLRVTCSVARLPLNLFSSAACFSLRRALVIGTELVVHCNFLDVVLPSFLLGTQLVCSLHLQKRRLLDMGHIDCRCELAGGGKAPAFAVGLLAM